MNNICWEMGPFERGKPKRLCAGEDRGTSPEDRGGVCWRAGVVHFTTEGRRAETGSGGTKPLVNTWHKEEKEGKQRED